MPRRAASLTRRWSLGGRLLEHIMVTVGMVFTVTVTVEVTFGDAVTGAVTVEVTFGVTCDKHGYGRSSGCLRGRHPSYLYARRWSIDGRLMEQMMHTVGVVVTVVITVKVTVGVTATDTVTVEVRVEVPLLVIGMVTEN